MIVGQTGKILDPSLISHPEVNLAPEDVYSGATRKLGILMSIYVSIYLSIYLSIHPIKNNIDVNLCIYLYIYLCIYPIKNNIDINLCIYQSIQKSIIYVNVFGFVQGQYCGVKNALNK